MRGHSIVEHLALKARQVLHGIFCHVSSEREVQLFDFVVFFCSQRGHGMREIVYCLHKMQ